MNAKVRSFDVFDTSLTRLVGRPASIFMLHGYLLVRRGVWKSSPEQFAAARLEAERRARRSARTQEVTLDTIYNEMAFAYDLSAEEVRYLQQTEIQLETRLLRAVPETQREIDAIRRARGRIIFISDTYFPRSVIEDWLQDLSVATAEDRVWASSESGVTKEGGDLFREAIRHERIEPQAMVHIGDNIYSDVTVPTLLGIRALHFDRCNLTRYEQLMEECAADTVGVSSLFAGTSRWVRLSFSAHNRKAAIMRDIVAGVAGPVICAYVAWVLKSALDLGLGRLLFVSRDGQVMLKVARQLAPKLGVSLELSYFYGGRQVLNVAGLQAVDSQAIEWIVESAASITLVDVLQRVGLAISDVSDEVQRYALPEAGAIGWERIDALKAFLSDAIIADRICTVAVQRRNLIRAYLSSCGLADASPCGIVDIGWRGRVFGAIRQILADSGGSRHTGLYFGLFARPRGSDPEKFKPFMFDLTDRARIGLGSDIPCLASVMEIFCQADHGPVLDMIPNQHGYEPVLRTQKNECGPAWDVPYFQRCLELYAEALPLDPEWCVDADLRSMCERLLRAFITEPTRDEAEVLGAFHYNDDQNGAVAQPFAIPYRVSDFRSAFRGGTYPKKAYAWWEAGALAMTSRPTRRVLDLACRLHTLRSTAAWRALYLSFRVLRTLRRRVALALASLQATRRSRNEAPKC